MLRYIWLHTGLISQVEVPLIIRIICVEFKSEASNTLKHLWCRPLPPNSAVSWLESNAALLETLRQGLEMHRSPALRPCPPKKNV